METVLHFGFLSLQFLWVFAKTWWWVFVPFLMWPHARLFWLWWRGWRFELTLRRILLNLQDRTCFARDNNGGYYCLSRG